MIRLSRTEFAEMELSTKYGSDSCNAEDPAGQFRARRIRIRQAIPGWSDDGASHRMNYDTPPLKGLRLEPFGSIRNHYEESTSYAQRKAIPGSNRNLGSLR